MINIDQEALDLLKFMLNKHIPDATVWLFGSRSTDQIKPHSDIGLAIIASEPLAASTMAYLETELIESDLPYKVDLVEWSTLDDDFKAVILNHYSVIQGFGA